MERDGPDRTVSASSDAERAAWKASDGMPEGTPDPWVTSGARSLTGWPDVAPLVPPPNLVRRIEAIGQELGVDALSLVVERSAVLGLRRAGSVSCGGATRLLAAADGWVAVSLARPEDLASVPAWLEVDPAVLDRTDVDRPDADRTDVDRTDVDRTDVAAADRTDVDRAGTDRTAPADDPAAAWSVVERAVARRSSGELVTRGALLGLPVAQRDEARDVPAIARTRLGDAPPVRRPLVVDLSSLWAGPLCARLLRRHGARTVKVESITRPDGARRGSADFFTMMNAGTRVVALDLPHPRAVDQLRSLLLQADVVIEASRPRALEQLDIDAAAIVTRGPSVWISITGYGRTGDGRNRVAFGDDAAVAGGLVAVDPELGPCFVADAIADPLSGMYAARAALTALDAGGRWLLDISMAGVAAEVAGAVDHQWKRVPAEEVSPNANQDLGRAPIVGDGVWSELR